MTFQHDPVAPYPIVPKNAAPIKRRRWPWILAAVLTVLFVIGKLTPDAETADSAAQLAGSAALTTNPTATLLSPTASVTPILVAPLTPPAPALLIDSPAAATSALTQLSTLDVKGRAAETGYDQSLFGQVWSDDVAVDGGRNGCDTRNDVLRRDLTAVTTTARSGGCVVITGVLSDPYTDTDIAFSRGEEASTSVQIDHLVALSDAWQKGAQQLDPDALRNFANDPRNLQAVDGPTKSAKADGDAATWLPPNHDYRCTYVARQIQVKADYQLWVTEAELEVMARLLTGCGGTAPTPETTTTQAPPAPVIERPAVPAEVLPAPAPIQVYPPAPQIATGGSGGGSCGTDSYINSAGNCVHSPVQAPSAPTGASARCEDGTYSFSQSRRGTCSGHGGVAAWL